MVAVHPQRRIVRLAMLLAICLLTVFLYASYYASPGLSIPNRIHIVSSSSSSSGVGTADFDATSAQLTANNINSNELDIGARIRSSGVDDQPHSQPQADDLRSSSIMQTDSGEQIAPPPCVQQHRGEHCGLQSHRNDWQYTSVAIATQNKYPRTCKQNTKKKQRIEEVLKHRAMLRSSGTHVRLLHWSLQS